MNKNITELFCFVDDYCKTIDENFANILLSSGKKPTRVPEIKYSEIITIILLIMNTPNTIGSKKNKQLRVMNNLNPAM